MIVQRGGVPSFSYRRCDCVAASGRVVKGREGKCASGGPGLPRMGGGHLVSPDCGTSLQMPQSACRHHSSSPRQAGTASPSTHDPSRRAHTRPVFVAVTPGRRTRSSLVLFCSLLLTTAFYLCTSSTSLPSPPLYHLPCSLCPPPPSLPPQQPARACALAPPCGAPTLPPSRPSPCWKRLKQLAGRRGQIPQAQAGR